MKRVNLVSLLYMTIGLFLSVSLCITEVHAFGIKLEKEQDKTNEKTDTNDDASATTTTTGTEEPTKNAASVESGSGNESNTDTTSDETDVNAKKESVEDSSSSTSTTATDESKDEAKVETSSSTGDESNSSTEEKKEVKSEEEESATATATATATKEKKSPETPPNGEPSKDGKEEKQPIQQSGPFIDLLGDTLLSLEMVDQSHAKLNTHYTNEALSGKKVIGLYFSADWCGPCRQFTPELVSFYEKMNKKKGNTFEIVWISRCRDVKSFGQYFTHMKWLALPPEEALGQRGQMLSDKFKVKGIPHFVLLDDLGNVITYDARNKIPQDKAGIGFPWRNPLATLYITFVPKTVRLMVKTHVDEVKTKIEKAVGSVAKKGK